MRDRSTGRTPEHSSCDGDMAGHRQRRIALTIAAVILLPVWYVLAWLTISRAERDGHISLALAKKFQPAFVPLLSFCESELPGAGVLGHVFWSVNPPRIVRGSENNGEIGFLKWWMHPTLAPPRTAEVDELVRAEFSVKP